MTPMIASILNFAGPDMMIILLIVFLLVGAKKLPELARGMGRAVKEFSAARDEIAKRLSQSGPSGVAQPKLSDTESKQASAPYARRSNQSAARKNSMIERSADNSGKK